MVVLARESQGLTQKDLAAELGITQGEVSKIESGLRPVPSALSAKLAEVLNYPEHFFLQADQIYGPGIGELFHRKRQDVPAKVLAKVHAEINVRRMHLARLLRSVDIPECRIPHIDPHEKGANVEDIARSVRAAWHLPHGPIQNLTRTLEDAGGIVVVCDFTTSRIDAISQWIPGMPPMFFVNRDTPGDRLRFNLAHELGHMVMHQSAYAALEGDGEQEAHHFAAEFLMPERDIRPDLRSPTLAKLAALKPYWKVSMQALLMRASALGEISPRSARTLWMQLGKLGYRTREPAEVDIPRESPGILRELLQVHQQDLDYSIADLEQLLAFPEHRIRSTYFAHPSGLRVIG
jgi:Zn-dependent peptidase ImmA (M78 family)/transcriptional regulator with XRE-family HTH domain